MNNKKIFKLLALSIIATSPCVILTGCPELGGLINTANKETSVSGIIKDNNTGKALEGVTVKINEKTTTTDNNGFYNITGIGSGEYKVFISKEGYETVSETISITGKIVKDFSLKTGSSISTGSSPKPSETPIPTPQATSIPLTAVVSNFDNDSDGWKVIGDSQGSQGKIPTYFSSGGNTGGYIEAKDDASDNWYWLAPSKFLGNKLDFYNKNLKFDLKQSDKSDQYNEVDIVLEGAGIKLVYDTSNNPNLTWTSYSVSLNESGGWKKGSLSGTTPTQAEFRAVLTSVTNLWIRGEYQNGSDTGGLDNVIFGTSVSTEIIPKPFETPIPTPQPTPIPLTPVVSNFDNDSDSWKVIGDSQGSQGKIPTYFSSGGNTGGYIEAKDDASDNWYWLAPSKFLGNKFDFYNKNLKFDLKQSDKSDQYNEVDIVLEGAGIKLVYDTSNNPNLTWTSYSVALNESGGWKKGSLSGTTPTQAEFRAVLTSLTNLWIRGEYQNGSDTGSLDNVIFGQ